MPKTYQDLGISILYPDNWLCDEDADSRAITIESPEGAFITITRFEKKDFHDSATESPLNEAQRVMEQEYEEVESEELHKRIEDLELHGITQRFVYLDLIVTSHLLTMASQDGVYLVQIQAEDRDMTRLEQVFDAMLISIHNSIIE